MFLFNSAHYKTFTHNILNLNKIVLLSTYLIAFKCLNRNHNQYVIAHLRVRYLIFFFKWQYFQKDVLASLFTSSIFVPSMMHGYMCVWTLVRAKCKEINSFIGGKHEGSDSLEHQEYKLLKQITKIQTNNQSNTIKVR